MPEETTPIRVQVAKVNEAMRIVPSVMQQGAKRAFQKHGQGFIRTLAKTRLSGRPGLKRRTGALARAFQYTVLEEAGRITLRVWITGEARKYAAIHEYGGTITPKRAKFLAIPVGPALTEKAGVPRYGSPRDIPDLQYMRKKGGLPFMGKVENGEVVAYFLLRKKVTIPPRLELGQTWKKNAMQVVPMLEKEANAALSLKFKGTANVMAKLGVDIGLKT